MANGQLLNHCGGRVVTRAELEQIPVPPPTKTWYPLGHALVTSRVETALQDTGFAVQRAQYSLARADARFFGVLDLASPLAPGVTLAVGIRNSLDKSFPIGFCAGSRVFVCDNLAFSSEVVVARKHTRFGDQRFSAALARAVQSLQEYRTTEAARIQLFQQQEVSELHGDGLLLRLWEQGILTAPLLPVAVRQWRQSDFEEFQARNFWSLYNAATFALAGRQKTNAPQFASLTIRLSGFLSAEAGVDVQAPAGKQAA